MLKSRKTASRKIKYLKNEKNSSAVKARALVESKEDEDTEESEDDEKENHRGRGRPRAWFRRYERRIAKQEAVERGQQLYSTLKDGREVFYVGSHPPPNSCFAIPLRSSK